MRRLGCGHDPLSPRELHARGECVVLADRHPLDEPQLDGVAQRRRHSVIAQTAGMNGVGYEIHAQRVHLQ